jgi:hypothetical protein
MRTPRIVIACAASFALASRLGSQAVCTGPGAAFGVVAYKCADCEVKQENGATVWSFHAEPVITEVTDWSVLRAGDVVEAVNGSPITSTEGADAFANPTFWRTRVARGAIARLYTLRLDSLVRKIDSAKWGSARGRVGGAAMPDSVRRLTAKLLADSVDWAVAPTMNIRVRRDGKSSTLTQSPRCPGVGFGRGRGRGENVDVDLGGRAAGATIAIGRGRGGRAGRGIPPDTGAGLEAIRATLDAVENAQPNGSRFGFALDCPQLCAPSRATSGDPYMRYYGFPTIAATREGGPAAKSGLRVGDVVTKVDGASILLERGALRLFHADAASTLRLTVRRDGKESDFTLGTP